MSTAATVTSLDGFHATPAVGPGISVLRAPLRRGPGWLSWQQTRELLRPPAGAKRAAADQQNQGRLRPTSCGNHVAKGGTG